jgi:DNA-directed RNA polymerase specialized sigma24 family protein
MSDSSDAASIEADWNFIRSCVQEGTQQAWSAFFVHFEPRFRKWISRTLRDRPDTDRDDVYQTFAETLLSGKILARITPGMAPAAYVRKSLVNHCRKSYQRWIRHREVPLDDDTRPAERLQLAADRAEPVNRQEMVARLIAVLAETPLRPKHWKTLEAMRDHSKIVEIAAATGYSTSAVQRYVKHIERCAYKALNIPQRDSAKKTFRKLGKTAS